MNKEQLKKEIDRLEKKLENFEVNPEDHEREYDDCINEQGEVIITGITFSPADILKEIDPTAYRCGLIDFVDACIDRDDLPEYRSIENELEDLKNELEDLEENEEKTLFD